jgi:Protein of unknown function (DUF4019)
MKRRFQRALGAILLPALVAAAGAAWPARAAEGNTVAAQNAADQWLALVDAGKYGESWDQAAQMVKKSVSRKDWIDTIRQKRKALGKLVSRKLTKADVLKNVAGLPPGEYVGIQYLSAFQNSKSTAEVVVPVLEKDGKWRVSEYIAQSMP